MTSGKSACTGACATIIMWRAPAYWYVRELKVLETKAHFRLMVISLSKSGLEVLHPL